MRRQVIPKNALILHHIEVLMLKSSFFIPLTENSVLGTGSTSMIEITGVHVTYNYHTRNSHHSSCEEYVRKLGNVKKFVTLRRIIINNFYVKFL